MIEQIQVFEQVFTKVRWHVRKLLQLEKNRLLISNTTTFYMQCKDIHFGLQGTSASLNVWNVKFNRLNCECFNAYISMNVWNVIKTETIYTPEIPWTLWKDYQLVRINLQNIIMHYKFTFIFMYILFCKTITKSVIATMLIHPTEKWSQIAD